MGIADLDVSYLVIVITKMEDLISTSVGNAIARLKNGVAELLYRYLTR